MKSKEKKRLKNWQWFNTFMMETHFHGFNMAANAKSRCELFTWLSMILLCFLLTVCQTISLVNLYKSEPTMSVTTVNHEGTFTCGNSQVCFTWDLDQEGLLEDSKSVDSLLAEFTHEQLQQLKNGNVSSSTFHPSLLRLTIAMLNDITRYEGNAMGYQKKMLEATWGYHNNKIHETKNYALHQIHQFFVNREVSMKLLMSSVVSITCQVFLI